MVWELDTDQFVKTPTVASEDPPPETTVSVPFKWEEAPGKARHRHTESELENSVTKTLELPPRLLFLEAVKGSPTTVLDGPYVGRAMSFTSSYRTPRVHWNSNFGSNRWTAFRKVHKEATFDFSQYSSTAATVPQAKITSSFTLSKATSHFWASIYESFKQVVPWRRKQQRKCTSKFDTV